MRKFMFIYVVLFLAIPCLALAQGTAGSLSGSEPAGAGMSTTPGAAGPATPSSQPETPLPRDPAAGPGLGTEATGAGSEAGLGTEAPGREAGRVRPPGSTSDTYRQGQGLPSGTGGPGPGAVPGSTGTGVYESRERMPGSIGGPASQVPGGYMPGTRMPGSQGEGSSPGTSRYPGGSSGTGGGLGTGTSR